MVEVIVAYKHRRYKKKKNWLNSLREMSNVEVFDMRNSLNRSFDIHMDQKGQIPRLTNQPIQG